mmetsp:Transcript_160516/g.490680  ORF Transcript_160516/g.490680 Transcript_160516/m.490680 type:complete len:153 (-) Transcript_160516:334-792(-)
MDESYDISDPVRLEASLHTDPDCCFLRALCGSRALLGECVKEACRALYEDLRPEVGIPHAERLPLECVVHQPIEHVTANVPQERVIQHPVENVTGNLSQERVGQQTIEHLKKNTKEDVLEQPAEHVTGSRPRECVIQQTFEQIAGNEHALDG